MYPCTLRFRFTYDEWEEEVGAGDFTTDALGDVRTEFSLCILEGKVTLVRKGIPYLICGAGLILVPVADKESVLSHRILPFPVTASTSSNVRKTEALINDVLHDWVIPKQGTIRYALCRIDTLPAVLVKLSIPAVEKPFSSDIPYAVCVFSMVKERAEIDGAIPIHKRMEDTHHAATLSFASPIAREDIDDERTLRQSLQSS
jgi:hypothetical protein